MMQVLLVEHDEVGTLYPFSETHCSWELRAGLHTIAERWQASVPGVTLSMWSHRFAHLESFQERAPLASAPYRQLPTLVVAAHLLASPHTMRSMVERCRAAAEPVLFYADTQPVGAYLPQAPATVEEVATAISAIDVASCTTAEYPGRIVSRLWDIFDALHDAITWDSAFVPEQAAPEGVVIDRTHGPVLLDEGVVIEPFVYIKGPVAIGKGTFVKAHSRIVHAVIGPRCKVAGEIEDSVFHGYSNKQHDGFVGHSYIGEWVNLGAGTTTSDLKNTYGSIRMTMPWGKEDSGRMFVGSLIGDHAKTAIGTRLTVGTVIGVCSVIVQDGIAGPYIPAYRWLGEHHDTDRALHTARAVMLRRGITLGPKTDVLLRSLDDSR